MAEVITEQEIDQIIEYGRALVRKVPWRHQGRSLRGVDCVGLFYVLGKAVGLELEMGNNYTRTPDPAILEAGMAEHCSRILKRDSIPGDLALIKYGDKTIHLVMFTDKGIIHCSRDMGTVVEHSIDQSWDRNIVSVWRLKGRVGGR